MTEHVSKELDPHEDLEHQGEAKVMKAFAISREKNVAAGCVVSTGEMIVNSNAIVVRNGETICKGKISQLRKFKEEVKKVKKGSECGISISNVTVASSPSSPVGISPSGMVEFEEGDVIKHYKVVETQRKVGEARRTVLSVVDTA